jgi:hypothetical protein
MRPVSKQQLGKHVPEETNARNNGRAVFSKGVRTVNTPRQQ